MAHILVIEDEPHIRFLTCKVLQTAGHTTAEAEDGMEGLHTLYRCPGEFDAVIMDVQMPKLDGYQLLDMLKRQPFAIPIIVLTSHRGLCQHFRERGAMGGLTKPVNRRQLLDLIDHLLNIPPDSASQRTTANQFVHH